MISRSPRRPRTGTDEQAARRDRGSTSLEFAVLSVAFLLLVFLVVQGALFYHARNVVKAEAEGVARTVRAYRAQGGDPAQVQLPSQQQVTSIANAEATRQWQILDNSGNTTSKPQVTAQVIGFNQVQVTIQATPILVFPGIGRLTITATAGGPFEVFKRSGSS